MAETVRENPLLKVEQLKMYFPLTKGLLSKTYSWVKAVDGISFEIYPNETFGLVGESGCGKSTTGKCAIRVLQPTEGRVVYKGRDIAGLSKSMLKPYRRELQLIFQDPYGSLNPRQSVFSILKEAVVLDRERHTAVEANERVDELLTLVGLDPDMKSRYPHEMSGGQRQRLGIARALACNPKLVVCDEPVSALDVSIQAQIVNLFRELQAKLGLTYLFIAHDLAVVRHMADRIAIMYLGKIVEVIDSDHIFREALHPYTVALLSALPTTDYYQERKRSRIILEGEVPSPVNKPAGCAFHPRCKYATETCRQVSPGLRNVGRNHCVACHNVAV
ncbi:MAG: ABC transporter ATP-binding protein [Firmicutes bacterium]|nr:ABC transporter ATP-binding protein [Bacillota bacterium]NLL87748.1 ABC transporter ATP-binding protein [Bacillota bacterium]